MLKTDQEELLSLFGDDCKLPGEPEEWLPSTTDLVEELVDGLVGPTRELLDQLGAEYPDMVQSVNQSASRFQEAEELLRMLRDYGNATASITSAGQLASHLEQALSQLNFLIGGLVANEAASYLDLVHLKRELQHVWNVLRTIEKKLCPFEQSNASTGGDAS